MTSQTCNLSNAVLSLACPFYSLKTKRFVEKLKSPVANIRKMLLMKDRSFLYEMRAYLIYVEVGENSVLPMGRDSSHETLKVRSVAYKRH